MKCSFIGHRDSIGLEAVIYPEIKKMMKAGITEFYSGGMGNFDKMCEKAVKELGGTLVFVPYNMKQVKLRDGQWYDAVFCPFGSKEYEKFDIPNRNKWLVEQCDIFLCNVKRPGGAMHTFNYAVKMKKTVINLAQ